MTDKQLQREMEKLANEQQSLARNLQIMFLLNKAYNDDMRLFMACECDSAIPGMARQAYMDVMGKRMLVCVTSKQRARSAAYKTT